MLKKKFTAPLELVPDIFSSPLPILAYDVNIAAATELLSLRKGLPI
jgi:hypothetical protein